MNTINIWCWLIPLLCTLLGLFFGCLICCKKKKIAKLTAEIDELKNENKKLKDELSSCQDCLKAKTEELASFADISPKAALIPFAAAAAKAVFGRKIKENDLTIIEGIGPVIEELFNAADINTWKELSETDASHCKEILDAEGTRFSVHDPTSWPLQAKMAYQGKWEELLKWQEEHNHGKL